ncbi:hypothetical protein [Tessaracoccus flavescens]|uniref:Uncharacterized protein n=1 Tax=Tessaracoccus flavescens TaxID=399497 RepID=A0A1Q2CYI4_9ACTN|nr:hypothetical protein [Tessaracoccus flavescens]AQP51180.1 hypothetical protein BW733_10400 [Tessaracoccus flavescens]
MTSSDGSVLGSVDSTGALEVVSLDSAVVGVELSARSVRPLCDHCGQLLGLRFRGADCAVS